MDRVFRRHKTSEVSVVKSRKKFLADKDGQQRLKHLRILIGQLDHAKLHQFFQENFSAIFYTFSDSFYSLECDIKQKSNLKDLHGLLSVFESILLLLPGIIHQRWQYNCILEILEELLDGRNALSVRKEGIRLFLIWFQILGTNATAKCHQVFTNLVPGFGDIILKLQKRGSSRVLVSPTQQIVETCRGGHGKQPSVVQPREPVVLVPPTSESNEGNLDIGLELLEYFLKVLVTEVSKITWTDRLKEHHLLQFWFLFEQLKRTYLPLIFPCLSPAYSVYESTRPKSFESHSVIKNLLRDYPISDTQLSVYQECFVLWITRYINANACHGLDSVTAVDDRTVLGVHSTGQHNSRAGSISVPKSPIDGNPVDPRLDAVNPATSDSQQFSFDSETRRDSKPEGMDETRGSLSFQSGQRFSVMAYGLADRTDHRPSTISLHNYPKESSHVSPGEVAMVCAVLYGCRQNINLLHDILHHAFLLPMTCYHALFAVVDVYHSWLKDKATRPIFLQEIDSSGEWILQPGRSNIVAQLCSPLEDKGHEGDDEAEYPRESVTNNKISTLGRRGLTGSDHSPVFNSDSDSSSPTNNAINMESYQNGVNHAEELRGCLQITIQVMFNNMSKIFLLTCSPAVTTTIDDPQGRKVPCTVDYVRKQIELCKSILLFFRSLAINIDLSTESWTTLLSTLLEVLNLTMVGRLPSDRVDDCWLSNEKLIRFMFQTMNIALLRASLVVPIANSLWDQCLTVYSQLTQWPALIIEWRTAMEILTSTMARLVYGVDLASIPDEKKSRHGKRNPGQPAIARTRPKSFTDAAVNYLPGTPVPLPATTALSQSSVHVTSGDIAATGGMVSQNIPIMDGESSHGRLSSCSNNRVRTPNVPTTAAEWSEARADGSNNFEFARLNADPPPIFQADEEDSVSLDLNGALGEDETDTEMRSRNRSKSRITIPRSTAGTPRQDKRGTLVPSTDSNFFSLRRAASEVRTASGFSPHDPTFGVADTFTRSGRSAAFGPVRSATRTSVSPDNLSVLSIGSVVVDRRSRKISPMQSYESPLQKLNGTFPSSPSPPAAAMPVGLDDDSSSNLSRNENATSSRTSAEETSDHVSHRPKIFGRRNTSSTIDEHDLLSSSSPATINARLFRRMSHVPSISLSSSIRFRDRRSLNRVPFRHTVHSYGLNSSPQSNLGDRQCANDRESMILPDSVRPTSRYFHRGDTITADSPHQVLAVDSLKTPTKSRFQPHATALVTRDTYTPRCVLAGGQARGWTPDSVVVCWRRFLGILGRVNTIKSVSNLERIYAYFSDLTNTLLKIREHQLLGPVSDDCVQPIPDYIVPVDYILPTLFEALQLPNHPGSVKLSAIRTLSDAVIRPTDGKISEEVLSQFYLMLHRLLTAYDEPCLREVIRSCGPRFFGSNLPGIHLLLLDFLRGASFVLDDQSGVKEVPRTQALLMYTSLLCYPYHFGPFESLEPSSPATFKLVTCSDLKTKLLHALTQASRADPNAEVRCLALAALAMHCVVELVHFRADRITRPGQYPTSSTGTFLVDALVVLLGMMRFPDHSVAVVAVEMILMLADHCDLFLDLMPRFPLLIIRSAVWTLRLLWHTVSSKLPAVDKRLLVSLIVCLVEWTLRLPALLVRTPNSGSQNDGDSSVESNESTLSLVMSALYMVVCYPPSGSGSKQIGEETTTSTVPDAYSPFPDPLIDLLSECQIKIELQSFSISKPHLDASSLAMKSYLMADFGHPWSGFQLSGDEAYSGLQSVRLAARVALCQILNYQDHFPLDSQGALLNTFIQEHHDQMTDGTARDTTSRAANEKELTTEILESSNVQIFVINSSVLVSLLSLPASSIDHIGSGSRSRSRLDSPKPFTSTSDSTAAAMAEIFSPRPLVQSTSSTQTKPHFPHSAVSDSSFTRIIVRDFSGKYSWDLSCLYGQWNDSIVRDRNQSVPCDKNEIPDPMLALDFQSLGNPGRSAPPCPPPRLNPNPPPLTTNVILANASAPGMGTSSPTPVTQAGRCDDCTRNESRSGSELPRNITPQSSPATSPYSLSSDVLNSLLREISSNSPECSINWGPTPPGASDNSDPASCLNTSCFNMEALTGEQIIAQRHLDQEAIDKCSDRRGVSPVPDTNIQTGQNTCPTPTSPIPSVFDPFSKWAVHSGQFAVVRHLFNQLGFLSWERRRTVELVQKSAGLVRDLKHLDKLGARETHKIAVFYVSAGQEDKQSILSNQTASLEFENFVAGLGWEVDLHTHRGFRGGLERSGRAGNSTPYYATATVEVIFHVSTRMPSSTQEDLKYKHLGNDEVMIIWTENARAFSRSMLRTQFGDVLIIITPLASGLFRVDVRRESDVGFFGPIVQCAILDGSVLPSLVRATAINASRAIRTRKPGYRAHNEERACSLRQLISRHTSQACFEVFAESLFLASASNELAMSPNPGQQSTDPNDTAVTRTQDFPVEPVPVAPIPVSLANTSSATPVPPVTSTIGSRAGPVAKVSPFHPSQYRVSFVDGRVIARSREQFPQITIHPSTPVRTFESNDGFTNPVCQIHQSPKSRSRHHKQYSSVDRAYEHHPRSDKSPVVASAAANIKRLDFLQSDTRVPVPPHHPHHLKHLPTHKSHRHT